MSVRIWGVMSALLSLSIMPASAQPSTRTDRPVAPPITDFVQPDGTLSPRVAMDPDFPYRDLVERVEDEAGVSYRLRGGHAEQAHPTQVGEWSGFQGGLFRSDRAVIQDVAVLPNGHVVVGGWFTEVGDGTPATNVAAWDGSRWYQLGDGLPRMVEALAIDADGDLIAGGSFDDAARGLYRIARWDGTAWQPMGSGLSGTVLSLDVDASGTVYAGGCFSRTSDGATTLNYAAAWDGSSWMSVGGGMGGGCVQAVSADDLGNVFVTGHFSMSADGTATGLSHVARWDGSAWAALGPGLDQPALSLAADGSGGVYAGGYLTSTGDGATPLAMVARWDGAGWSTVAGGLDNTVYALDLGATGDLYATGYFNYSPGGPTLRGLAVWDGFGWAEVGGGVEDGGEAVGADPLGGVVVAGAYLRSVNGHAQTVSGVARWNGVGWTGFDTGGGLRRVLPGYVQSIEPDDVGGIYVAGDFDFTADRQTPLRNVARWTGSEWDDLNGGFGSPDNGAADDIAFADGVLYVSGGTGFPPFYSVYRWDGGSWSRAFTWPALAPFQDLLPDGAGGLYAAGYLDVSGVYGGGVLHWDGTSVAPVGGLFNDFASTLEFGPDGALVVGGQFTASRDGATSLQHVARWSGTAWEPLGAGLDNFVFDFAVSDGVLVAGGQFNGTAGGTTTAQAVAAWDGSSWAPVGDGLEYRVEALLPLPDGRLLAGGSIVYSGGFGTCCYDNVVAWDGTSWETLAWGTAGEVRALALDGAGDLIVGGPFSYPYANPAAGPGVALYDLPSVASGTSIVIDGERGPRYLGPPAAGVTVDDLAAQNLVRGVPGYFPEANANLWTDFDPVAGTWLPSAGTGEVLPLGKAFRWQFLDRDGVGDPEISVSVALPFTLSTDLPANTSDVSVELDTDGTRFNHLANPFGADLDLSSYLSWTGWQHIRGPLYVYDDDAGSWETAPATIGPWEAFRFRSKGPKGNGGPRILTIPASAALPLATKPGARTAASAVESESGLTFRLEGLDASGRPLADGMLAFEFSDGSTPAFSMEENDVEKFQPPSTRYVLLGARVGEAFAGHDARPWAPAEIPLGLEARGAASAFTLTWDAAMLPAGLPVTLVDLATGAEVDVRRASTYAFEIASRPALEAVPTHDLADGAAATDRFVLRIGDVLAAAEGTVSELGLEALRPNPAAGAARVAFTLPEASAVRLAVYDVRGREVAVLADGRVEAGRHEAGLDTSRLAAGVYVVRLEAGGEVLTRRATVVR